jgi:hypothetical protein
MYLTTSVAYRIYTRKYAFPLYQIQEQHTRMSVQTRRAKHFQQYVHRISRERHAVDSNACYLVLRQYPASRNLSFLVRRGRVHMYSLRYILLFEGIPHLYYVRARNANTISCTSAVPVGNFQCARCGTARWLL